MTEALLQTKLYLPPLRPNLVPRPHLIERLDQSLQPGHRLTLISAPAGFGKTTLIAEWLGALTAVADDRSQIRNPRSEIPYQSAWLSLDEGESDLARFLTYLIAAFNRLGGTETTIGRGALGILQSPQPPSTEAIITSLINDIAAVPGPIILVLDDYHVVDAPPVDDALIYLLEHLPPQLHLVIVTREDPHLPLARLRARGQLAELRAADLCFTFAEAVQFLNQVMGLNLTGEAVAALETRTEGWIAGLKLAAISMQGREDAGGFIKSFTGSHSFILDYLIEDVLEQQPGNIQSFLLQTAVLDRMTGPLCDALTGREGGQATLEKLEQINLFVIPLDEERHWYRYHQLFSDLLRLRLRQTQRDQIPLLNCRASEWHEQNGQPDEAIKYALRAEDFEGAAGQIERTAESVRARGGDMKLGRWLESLPDELLFARPQLCIYYAWYLLASGKQDEAEGALRAAESGLETGPDLTSENLRAEERGPGHMALRGRIAATRAFAAFYRGDIDEIILYARQALQFLPQQDLSWRGTALNIMGDIYDFRGETADAYRFRLEAVEMSQRAGNIYVRLITNAKLAIILRNQGRLKRAVEICEEQQRFAVDSGMDQTDVSGWLLAIWGEVLAELNDLDGAISKATKGVELTECGGDLAMLAWSYLCLIRVLFSAGDLAGAGEIVQKLEETDRKSDVPPWIMVQIAAWQARIWLARGRLDAASRWATERELGVEGEFDYLQELAYIVLARILIDQGKLEQAIDLLERLLLSTEQRGRVSRTIEILTLQAVAFQAANDRDRAMARMERALALAEPGGFVRVFVDEGRPISRLLHEMTVRGIAPDYVVGLMAAFTFSDTRPDRSSRTHSPIHDSQSKLVEPLSERELEVLGLIAKGLTNQEIASRLFLSLNTVKAHTRNIYAKLDVHNRTQAVAKARTLDLLSPN